MKLSALVGGTSTVIGREATLGDAAEALIDDAVGGLAVVDGDLSPESSPSATWCALLPRERTPKRRLSVIGCQMLPTPSRPTWR